ncbi:MAG: hypothetical protein HOQ24_08345 [Mycobacteriaceae bacterium]|nr:hypothetical protein [Mycobacteriaceae bacterium]
MIAAIGLLSASAPVAAQACQAGATSDFDGDGLSDLAIGDPDATVSGQARSGRVSIAYADQATQKILQAQIPGNDNGAGDRFGHAMASTDWNKDGCSDLVVGMPYETSSAGAGAAGAVVLIPGSTAGLVPSQATFWTQEALDLGASEAQDRFGFSIAAGTSSGGKPFIVAGNPGESIGTITNTGAIGYITPSFVVGFHQDSAGVPGVAEPGDLFGYSVAASPSGFVVGTPAEAIGTLPYAGSVVMYGHPASKVIPTAVGGADQDSDGVSGTAEAGDLMGAEIAMADYTDSSGTSTLVVVGAPGEDGDNGWVLEFDADGSFTQRRTFSQVTAGDLEGNERGDAWGGALSVVNRAPGAAATWDKLLVVGGAPGEDKTGAGLIDRGTIQVISGLGAVGDHAVGTDSALTSAGLVWESGQRIGTSFHATKDHLYIADPWSSKPAVYGIPWANLLSGGTAAVVKYTPATFGLGAADSTSFGASLA